MESNIGGRGAAGTVLPDASNTQERQLRIALAMRGGVSLAVWIGGGVREVDRLRQAKITGHSDYLSLLELNGFNDVIVDVMSGASAGGLNAVLYAMSQVYGFEAAETRSEWIRLADIEPLTLETTAGLRARGASTAGFPISKVDALRPPSLMRGDAYFFTSLDKALESLIGDRDQHVDPDRIPRIDMLLSATLVEPTPIRRLVNARTAVLGSRSKALFRFRQSSRDAGQDDLYALDPALAADPEARTEQRRRLAMAARSTSSFPIAFEPATILTTADSALHDERDVNRPTFPGSLFEVPDTKGAEWQYVMDGGVLDNIPVGKAIGAIVDAPADGPTERWLCYLHPSPKPPIEQSLTRRSFRSVQTTATTLFARFNQESLLGDVDELLGVNDAITRRNLLRNSLLADVNLDSDLLELNSATLEALEFARLENAADQAGVEESWPAPEQAALHDAIHDVVSTALIGRERVTITELSDATALLIAFARELENGGRGDDLVEDGRSVGEIKLELYAQSKNLAGFIDEEKHLVERDTISFQATLSSEVTEGAFAELRSWNRTQETKFQLVKKVLEQAASALAEIIAELEKPFSLIDAEADHLWRLIRVLLPVQLIGRGPWSPINFVYIRGDARTPLEWSSLRSSRVADQPDVEERLAGNTLGNFAAFLSARWRANDWMWGRLDASSTLIDALVPKAVFESLETETDWSARVHAATRLGWAPGMSRRDFIDAIVERVQLEIVIDEFAQQNGQSVSPTPIQDSDEEVRQKISEYAVGAEKLRNLPEKTRLRVGARTAVVAFAAFRPAGNTLRDRGIRLLLSAIKPIYLVLALLLVSPLRAVMSLAVGGAALQSVFWVAREGDGNVLEPRWFLFGLGVSAAVVASAVGVWRSADAERTIAAVVRTLGAGLAAWAVTVGASGRYQVITVLGVAIGQFALPKVMDGVRRRQFDQGLALWLVALVVPGLGMAVGWHVEQPDQVSAFRILVPCVAAVFTVVASHIWATWFVRLKLVALALSSGLGMLLFVPGQRDGAGQWLWVACGVVALSMVGVAFVTDSLRLRRYAIAESVSAEPDTLLASRYAAAPIAVAAIAALAAYQEWLSFSFAAWSAWAVVAASYAVTLYGTFAPIFPSTADERVATGESIGAAV